jgi:signal peptidase II
MKRSGTIWATAKESDQLISDRLVVLLPTEPQKDPNTKAYTEDSLVRGQTIYVFHRGLDRAPRVVRTIRTAVDNEWLSATINGRRRSVLVEGLLSKTLAEVIAADQNQLSDQTINTAFEKGWVFPVSRLKSVGSDQNIVPGQVALVLDRDVTVISGFFGFRYAENPGAAWSFLASASPEIRFWFFTVIACIAIIVLLILSLNQPMDKKLPLWAYSMILGGAIGNLIDRIQSNFVIDFLDMYVGESHWPTYNIADIGISVGVGLLLLDMLCVWRQERSLARKA